MGYVVGYARVSSTDQDLEVQLDQLRQAGCTKIFAEKVSAVDMDSRKELTKCMTYLRDGDVLVVTRLDRLARSVKHFSDLLAQLDEKGVGFRCIHQPIDTTSPTGKLMMQMLAAFAEFELSIRKERQAEGIAKAKERGAYKNHGGNLISSQKWSGAKRMLDKGTSIAKISEVTGISESALYRRFSDATSTSTPPEGPVEALPVPEIEPIPDFKAEIEAVTGVPTAKKPGFLGKFLGAR